MVDWKIERTLPFYEEILDFVIDWREQMIRLAEMMDLESVLQITHDTISEIYSHYYAEGVVRFFLQHHRKKAEVRFLEYNLPYLLLLQGLNQLIYQDFFLLCDDF